MGGGGYSFESRALRASAKNAAGVSYDTVSLANIDTVFEQTAKREIHPLMNPKSIILRESRDSDEHPNSLPIIIALDLTGSMGEIPLQLLKDGLPTIIGNIIQHGQPDPQVLFLGVGDHECDRAPLQIAQFESSDVKLDTWLVSTFIEGNGGGNSGESYLLAHYVAGFHTATDAWDKRGQKGFLFTIGDEPNLRSLPIAKIKQLMNGAIGEKDYSDEELLKKAQEKWNVYHILLRDSSSAHTYWNRLLGVNCVKVSDYRNVAKVISEIVSKNTAKIAVPEENVRTKSEGREEIKLM
jgi:hypothetical protein